MPPTSGSGSLSGRMRRPGSGSRDLASGISQIDKNQVMTITDLFLQDVPTATSIDLNTAEVKPFIPLPTAMKSTAEQIRRQDSKHDFVKQQRQKAQSETKLQEYWKSNALWPLWPQLKESRERAQSFRDAFQEGINSPSLIRHCGEHLKCAAYVVICPERIGIRASPTCDFDKQTGGMLYPGEMAIVDNILRFDGVNFLKLRRGGWVFDKKGAIQCMSYMAQVEIGLWWYRLISAEYAEIRCSPNYRDATRTGHMLVPGEVIVITLRCIVDGNRWMLLADGRGWIFEMRPPIHGLADSADERVIQECDEQRPDAEEPVINLKTGGIVELGMWEYEVMEEVLALGSSTSGWLLGRGDVVLVDMRVPANGLKVKETSSHTAVTPETRIWLRLHDGRGWIPKTQIDGLPNVRFVKVPAPGSKHNPKHQNATKAEDVDWMSGVA